MALSSLLYASTARSDLTREDIDAIVETATRVNGENDVTGLLAFDGKGFAQILEGELDTIQSLYEKISRDPRHSGCVLLHIGPAERRRFKDWSLAYRRLSDLIMIQDMTA